eukprot:744706-Amorphochlora_amoeboformis.AAC.3
MADVPCPDKKPLVDPVGEPQKPFMVNLTSDPININVELPNTGPREDISEVHRRSRKERVRGRAKEVKKEKEENPRNKGKRAPGREREEKREKRRERENETSGNIPS